MRARLAPLALLAALASASPLAALDDAAVEEAARSLVGGVEAKVDPGELSRRVGAALEAVDPATLSPEGWAGWRLLEAATILRPDRLREPGRLWPVAPEGPAGREAYEGLLRDWHLLPMDAEDLRGLGREVWDQTRAALEAQAARMAPGRGWKALAREMTEDRPGADEVVALYRREVERAESFVREQGLVTVPAVPCVVELGREEGLYPFARYGSRGFGADYSGTLWATVPEADRPSWEVEELLRGQHRSWVRCVALHEAVPGHHLQRAVEFSAAVPPLWRLVPSTVTVEGWALYAEDLMDRAGYFDGDPEGRLAMLRMRLWRAARVLLDTGLHCFGEDTTSAERFLVEEVGLEPANARAEVRRYLASPTQPASYVLGWRLLSGLRAELAGMDDRAFHDRVLACGSVPLSVSRDLLLGRSPRWN
ncbi:MAG: DUF885 domain-containing protein [Planctomycetes bacterium]|nr:DUF885 domain-containing protein [Planctomycetota bacterium]